MSETRAIASPQPSTGANTHAPDRPYPQQDTIARFRQALLHIDPRSATAHSSDSAQRCDLNTLTPADPERGFLSAAALADSERRDPNGSAQFAAATVASLHYSLPLTELAAEPAAAADTVEAARLIEQATSVLLERASRSDAARFIVSLDHAITGGASAEFVRDGAFLHVRLLARNEAAYRSMWTHRAELEERLAASTGLLTRIEVLEVYGDGRSG